ncbi:MAG: hypothetical protein IKW24_01415 [Clostridia bacterium]|nr:hypothetical protein [Clostridia bacterium]
MNRIAFGILTIIFNDIGVPCFIQGDVKTGILRIVLGVVTCGIISIINFVKGILLGIQILKMTDEEFEAVKDTISSGIPARK